MQERAHGLVVPKENRPDAICEIEPGIWYVDFTRIQDTQFDNRLPDLRKARGLVLDLRGKTPNVSDFPFSYLHDAEMTSPTFVTPRIRKPDRTDWKWDKGSWRIVPNKHPLPGRKVFLCDERTLGPSESQAYLVRRYGLGELVGSPTAGVGGLMAMGSFPGGFTIGWSGQRVQQADGRSLQATGILPTIPLSPTIASIRAGRDALIQKALELLRN